MIDMRPDPAEAPRRKKTSRADKGPEGGKYSEKHREARRRDSSEDSRDQGGYSHHIRKVLARAEKEGRKTNEKSETEYDGTDEEDVEDEEYEEEEMSPYVSRYRDHDDFWEVRDVWCQREMEERGRDGQSELAQASGKEERGATLGNTPRSTGQPPGAHAAVRDAILGSSTRPTEHSPRGHAAEGGATPRGRGRQRHRHRTGPGDSGYNLRENRMAPVLIRGDKLEYRPWAHSDMSEIREKLPVLHDGGHPWTAKMDEALVGTQAAMGDLKRLLSSILGVAGMEAMLMKAGLHRYIGTAVYDPELFSASRGRLWGALRETYPTQIHPDSIIIVPLGETENPRGFVTRVHEHWRCVTGRDPDDSPLEQSIVRDKIQQALPTAVKDKLAEVVGLRHMTTEVFTENVSHHVELYRRKAQALKAQDEEVFRKLIHVQLSEEKRNKERMQGLTLQATTTSQPNGLPAMQPVYYQPYPQGFPVVQSAVPYQPYPPGAPVMQPVPCQQYLEPQGGGGPMNKVLGPCFVCGKNGHLAQTCYRRVQGGGGGSNWQSAPAPGPVNPYGGPAGL